MKVNTLTAFFMLAATWLLLTNGINNPNNPPNGHTAAPGEQTCGKSNCHSGGTYTGTVGISGLPDTVVANQTYAITLTNASNAVRAGFQLTCLDGGSSPCGTLTAQAGVNIGSTSNGRQYARQASPKLLNAGSTAWTFNWKAPAAASGNNATFYYVSLCANNNNAKTGDNVLQGVKSVVLNASSSAYDTKNQLIARLYPTIIKDRIFVEIPAQKGSLIIFDQQGKAVYQSALTSTNELIVNQLNKGAYTVHITAEGKSAVKKIVVE
jgi:hypothetical protein